ncbi:MAG: peptidylprolyl isomerase [Synechococcales bacterium]|nr:peptidylprolyl isomerase [Synechococcales bacterium]
MPLLQQYGMMPALLRELVIDQAIADSSISPEEETSLYQQFYQQQQLQSETQLAEWLAERGMVRSQLETLVLRPLKIKRYQQETWGQKLESYFLQRKAMFDRVIYSLIRLKDFGIAQELFFQIQDGEVEFSDIARQYSQGVEAETGGLLGPVELRVPHPTLAKLLLHSQPGQLIPPTRLGEWVIILRMEKFLPAQFDTEMQQRLLQELFDTWLEEQVKQALNHLCQPNSSPESLPAAISPPMKNNAPDIPESPVRPIALAS